VSRRRRTLQALVAGLAVAVLALTGTACGAVDDGPRTQEIVIPFGTTEKLGKGEVVDVMPAELRFRVGDTLRIRNEDAAVQVVGPYRVDPGEEFELTYGAPGRYEGMCALTKDERYEIVITE
jgi:plastocyanin